MTGSIIQPSDQMQPQMQTNIDLMRILDDKDDLLATLQKDKEFYELQDKKMRMKISSIFKQLEEAQKESLKCKITT